MDDDCGTSLILGRILLATSKAIIGVENGELSFRLNEERVVFKILNHDIISPKLGLFFKVDAGEVGLNEQMNEEPQKLISHMEPKKMMGGNKGEENSGWTKSTIIYERGRVRLATLNQALRGRQPMSFILCTIKIFLKKIDCYLHVSTQLN